MASNFSRIIPVALAGLFLFSSTAAAEIKTFHAESSYFAVDSEPIQKAQESAFQNTLREISETANAYLKSDSYVKNSRLKQDDVEIFTAAVLKISSKNFSKNFTPDGKLEIIATVDAEMDTDSVVEILTELRAARNASKNFDAVLEDYTRRKNQFDTIYGDYINAFQKRVMQKIRDGCKLQNDGQLEEALKLYNEALEKLIARNAELSLVYVKRGQIYILQGKNELAAADFEKAVSLNNDSVGIHYARAALFDWNGQNSQAVGEYRAFVKDADIVYYDVEIYNALGRIVELESDGAD